MAGTVIAPPRGLTWEDYLLEGYVPGSYSILDGVREFAMAGPTFEHQEIVANVLEALRGYQRRTGAGRTLPAPFDVVISRDPLRVRQPDVLFVTAEALARAGGRHLATPLTVPPALVVEVLSESETLRGAQEKVLDYCRLGVPECWLVSPQGGTIEVLRLTPAGPERAQLAGRGDTVASVALPGLEVPVDSLLNAD